jgi:hypothetical protein
MPGVPEKRNKITRYGLMRELEGSHTAKEQRERRNRQIRDTKFENSPE